jgi:hypothetical protein
MKRVVRALMRRLAAAHSFIDARSSMRPKEMKQLFAYRFHETRKLTYDLLREVHVFEAAPVGS